MCRMRRWHRTWNKSSQDKGLKMGHTPSYPADDVVWCTPCVHSLVEYIAPCQVVNDQEANHVNSGQCLFINIT